MMELLKYARAGDTVVVWRIDRLGRSLLDVLTTVHDMRDDGISVRSISDGIDPSTISGRLMLSRRNHDPRPGLVVTWTPASAHMVIVRSGINQQLGTELPEETIYCEMCWTNPGHAHIRDLPICSQCIGEFKITRRLVSLDKHPYEPLDEQHMTDAEAKDSGEFLRFNPPNTNSFP